LRRKDKTDLPLSDRIFLVRKEEFDSMENDINAARTITIVGFTFSKQRAEAYINEMENETHRKAGFYKGWDGFYYPKWTHVEVSPIPLLAHPVRPTNKA